MSMTFARLELTDGSTSIDLLRGGVYSKDYRPGIPQLKDGGIWQDNALATGRKLVDRRFGNVIDTFDMAISGPNQNDTIAKCGDLLRLLEKARDFSTSSWQSEPVWVKRQAGCESHPTYALVFDYSLLELANPFALPFAAATDLATLDGFDLGIEHSIWLSEPPGQSTCVQVSTLATAEVGDEWENLASPPGGINTGRALLQSITGRIFAGYNGDIIQSDDDGATWALCTAVPVGQVNCMIQTTTNRIIAGETGGVWHSHNDGGAWAFSVEAFTVVYSLLQLADGHILAGDDGQIWESTDGGDTWATVTTDQTSPVRAMIQLTVGAHIGRILAVETGKIWASDDNGVTWYIIAYNLSIAGVFYSLIQTTSGRLLGDATDGADTYIRKSDDGGTTWTIVANHDSGLRAFIQMASGRILVVGASPPWSSDDGGERWTTMTLAAGVYSLLQTTTGRVLSTSDDIFSYGPVSSLTMGATASCADEQFIANKHNTANLTHIYVASGGGLHFGVNLLPHVFPVTLLPPGPVANDAIYFGNSASNPFEALVFDIDHILTSTAGCDIIWEYSDGGGEPWAALTVTDGTNPFGGAGVFLNPGVNSVHWTPPTDWVAEDPGMGVTGLWVRARITDLHGGTAIPPTQQHRNIYSITWPDIDIAAAQVMSDIPALAQIKLRNRSDKDGSAAPTLWDNRIIIGLRSYDRGPTFTAYLNASDEQNPPGVGVATMTANTSIDANIIGITGMLCTYDAQIGDTTFADQLNFTLQPTIARDYYGTFHAYLRAGVMSGSSSDIHARLQVRTGTGGVTLETKDDYLKGTTDYEVLDFGRISIPASGLLDVADLGDSTVLALQFRNDSGATRTVRIHDLILIPVDELAIDSVDYANIAGSIIGHQSFTPHLLDVDSLTYQKVDVRTLVRTADIDEYVTSIYVASGGPMILQANAHQRLWVFCMNTSAVGTSYKWLAEPWVCHSVQVWCNGRWLGLRGDR